MRKGGGKVGRAVLAIAAGMYWTLAATAAVAPERLPRAVDLQADAHSAAQRRIPILLMFASETCGYCLQVEAEYLLPLLRDPNYADKVIIRKVLVRDLRPLVDFDGARVETGRFADRYAAPLVPTLVFVDAQGREISERLVGLTTLDFYWGYLQRSLDLAHEQLRAPTANPD